MGICPGQDTRYWGPDDVSEVACATCGYSVEFFKRTVLGDAPAAGHAW